MKSNLETDEFPEVIDNNACADHSTIAHNDDGVPDCDFDIRAELE